MEIKIGTSSLILEVYRRNKQFDAELFPIPESREQPHQYK